MLLMLINSAESAFPMGRCYNNRWSASPYDLIVLNETCFKITRKSCEDPTKYDCCKLFDKFLNKVVIKTTQDCEKKIKSVYVDQKKKGGGIYFDKYGDNEYEYRITSLNLNNLNSTIICVESLSPCESLLKLCPDGRFAIFDPFTHTCCPTTTLDFSKFLPMSPPFTPAINLKPKGWTIPNEPSEPDEPGEPDSPDDYTETNLPTASPSPPPPKPKAASPSPPPPKAPPPPRPIASPSPPRPIAPPPPSPIASPSPPPPSEPFFPIPTPEPEKSTLPFIVIKVDRKYANDAIVNESLCPALVPIFKTNNTCKIFYKSTTGIYYGTNYNMTNFEIKKFIMVNLHTFTENAELFCESVISGIDVFSNVLFRYKASALTCKT
jgi:hypothetical protein